MDFSFRYTAEDHCAALPVADYIARFRDAKRFLECCRACRNYGCSWGCPPFGAGIAFAAGSHDFVYHPVPGPERCYRRPYLHHLRRDLMAGNASKFKVDVIAVEGMYIRAADTRRLDLSLVHI